MTAVLVGFLVAVAGLAWSAAGAGGRRAPLRAWVGRGDLAGGAARAAPLTRRPGWLAARGRLGRAERAEADALELLDGLAPALRAGLPPVTALLLVTSSRSLDSAAPSRSPARPASPARAPGRHGALGPGGYGESAWSGLGAAASRGDPLAPAWWAYAETVDSDDLRLVAAAWSLCETLGSPLAPTVATVAEVVRSRRAVRQRTAAVLAGPQTTMRVLTALPLSGPVVAVAVGVAPSELYAGAAGAFSLVIGLGLLMLGRVWASRMVRSVKFEQHGRATRRRRKSIDARR